MMRQISIFCAVTVCNLLFVTLIYFGLVNGFSGLTVEPNFGDLDAVYLPLTAFGYTFQIFGLVAVMAVMNWFVFFGIKHVGWPIIGQLRFIYTYSILVLSAAVFANKVDWWFRLVFGSDRYGYYTTRPTAASILATLGCLGIIFVSVSQNYNLKVGAKFTAVVTAILLILSSAAAAHLAVEVGRL